MHIFSKLKQQWRFKPLNAAISQLFLVSFVAATILGASCSGNGPLTLVDDLGRTVTLDKVPQRIVSLAPSNTEILFALGLGDKVVGNTFYCDYPVAAQDVTKVGGFSEIDIELVVTLEPDLILAEDIHKTNAIPALEGLGFTVFALVPHNLDEIMDSVITIGRLTGTVDEAKTIVADMKNRIENVTDKVSGLEDAQKPNVLHVLWADAGIMSYGVNTPIYDVITKAGGVSLVQSGNGFPTLSLEYVIAANPRVVICDVDSSYPGGDYTLILMQSDERFKDIEARLSGCVYGIDADLTNRPGPRFVDALEWVSAMLHPDIFPDFADRY
ncbi:MAG: ABC transporter substrate-binding protein, partial [Dehalococcoidia bacterium]|nr:ABC transporter substrate-binding protein [Dehalococcoidia bacterium]